MRTQVAIVGAGPAGPTLAHLLHLEGIELRFEGTPHRIDLHFLTGGRTISVYGQQEVVKDLIAARIAGGGPLLFEVEDVRLGNLESEQPTVTYRRGGGPLHRGGGRQPPRARLRPPQHALAAGQPPLPPGRRRRDPGGASSSPATPPTSSRPPAPRA